MKLMTNQKVSTPIGEGMIQGGLEISIGGDVVAGVLVRMPINEQTRPHLRRSNCMTPKEEVSGLWVFQESELTV